MYVYLDLHIFRPPCINLPTSDKQNSYELKLLYINRILTDPIYV